MLKFRYLLVIFIALEWTFSVSFKIIENLPEENDIEAKLMEYLQNLKSLQENRWNSFKTSMKNWRKKGLGLKFCHLSSVLQQYLCRLILSSEKYDIAQFDKRQIGKCKNQKIHKVEQIFILKMVACVPFFEKDQLYLLSPTGEDQPSLYLFHWEKAEAAESNPHLVAKIVLSDSDLKELKRIRKEEWKKKFDNVLHYIFPWSEEKTNLTDEEWL